MDHRTPYFRQFLAEEKQRSADYTPKSLHESLTWHLDLPIDASASEIAAALEKAAAAHEKNKGKKVDHPASHMILITAINSPSDTEADALKTLAKVAATIADAEEENKKMKGKMKGMK